MIAMALRGGAKSKISKARFGKCCLTITPPEFSKVRERRIFRKKKLAGEDPLDPLNQICRMEKGQPTVKVQVIRHKTNTHVYHAYLNHCAGLLDREDLIYVSLDKMLL
jgi:hypothetical protein